MSDTMHTQQQQWDGAGLDAAGDGAQEEKLLLLSLALDGLLDAEEEARLRAQLADDAALAAAWGRWQRMDALFHAAPHADPAPGFSARFEAKLDEQARRARVRSGILYAVAGVAVWVAALAAVLLVGRFVWANQAEWASTFLHQLTLYPSAALIWLQALRSTATAIFSTPQSVAVFAAYCVTAVALLVGWLRYLQRSAQKEVGTYVESH